MLINALQIKNFKSLRDFRHIPGLINLVIGENSAGKTSIAQALQLILTGAINGKTGKELLEYIRDDERAFEISLDLSNVGVIKYKLTQGGSTVISINDMPTGKKELAETIETKFGITTQQLSILTSPTFFFDLLKPEKQGEILMGLLKMENFNKDFPALLTKELSKKTVEYLKKNHASLLMNDTVASLNQPLKTITALHTYFYDQRTEINREIKDLETRNSSIETNGMNYKEAEKKANETNEKLQGINQNLIDIGVKKAMPTREQIIEEKKALEKQLAEMPTQKQADKVRNLLETKNKAFSELQDDTETDFKLGILIRQKDILTKTLAELTSNQKMTCPYDPEYPCPADIKKFTELIKAKLEKANSQIPNLETKEEQRGAQIDQIRKEIETIETKEDQMKMEMNYKDQLQSQLNKCTQDLDKSPQSTEDLAEEQTELKEQKDRLQGEYDGLQRIIGSLSAQESNANKLKELLPKQTIINELAEFLAPKGRCIQLLINPKLEEFSKGLTETMKLMGLPTPTIEFKKHPEIRIGKYKLSTISKSERIRLGMTLQLAIAKMLNFPLLIADDLEAFYQNTGKQVFNLINQSNIQAFLIRVKHPKDNELKDTAKIKIVRLGE